jgi:hypothetical protein
MVSLLVVDIARGYAEPWHAALWIAFVVVACGLARLWLVRSATSSFAVRQVTLVAPYYPPEPNEHPDRLSSN